MMKIFESLLLLPILTGPIFVITGFILLRFPPREINGLYGYRTPGSMRSQERWDFAQKFSGQQMIKWGGILTGSSVLGFWFKGMDAQMLLGLGLMFMALIAMIWNTEQELKTRFPNK